MPYNLRKYMVRELKAFYLDFIDDKPGFVDDRRCELKVAAGLRSKDPKVPKFSFVHVEPKSSKNKAKQGEVKLTIGEPEVEHETNFPLVASLLAQFAHRLPRKKEFEAALQHISIERKLNPQLREQYEHEAWAITESGLHRALMAYPLNRFQRCRSARPGHSRMSTLKTIIKMRLQEAGKLRSDGKRKVSLRGVHKKASKDSMTASSSVTELEVDAHDDSQPEAETELDHESDDGVLDEVSADAMQDLELEDAFDEHDVQNRQEPKTEKPGAAVHPDNLDTLPYDLYKSLDYPEQAEDTAQGAAVSSGEDSTDEADQKANCNKDRKPLVALAPADAALEAAADKLCDTLENEAKDGDDIMKAQRKARQTLKKQSDQAQDLADEDPDREHRDQQSEDDIAAENEGGKGTKGKGKNRRKGRGKGKGRGKSSKGKTSGKQDASKEGAKGPETLPPRADEATATPRRAGMDKPGEARPGEEELVTPVQKPNIKRSKGADFSGEKTEKKTKKRKHENEKKEDASPEANVKVRSDTEEKNLQQVKALAAEEQNLFRFPMWDVGSAAKSFTLGVPWLTVNPSPSSIGVLLTTAGFYVSRADPIVTDWINKNDDISLKVDKKWGLSLYWNTRGGIRNAWRIAYLVAGWATPESSRPWEKAGDASKDVD